MHHLILGLPISGQIMRNSIYIYNLSWLQYSMVRNHCALMLQCREKPGNHTCSRHSFPQHIVGVLAPVQCLRILCLSKPHSNPASVISTGTCTWRLGVKPFCKNSEWKRPLLLGPSFRREYDILDPIGLPTPWSDYCCWERLTFVCQITKKLN